jgi:hypothetical protein
MEFGPNLKILNHSGFVSKIFLKNGLRVDFVKTEWFSCKMIRTLLIGLRVNFNEIQGFIYKIAMPHVLRIVG